MRDRLACGYSAALAGRQSLFAEGVSAQDKWHTNEKFSTQIERLTINCIKKLTKIRTKNKENLKKKRKR